MAVGILKGKKDKNNQLILQALHEQEPQTPWEISKYIISNDPSRQNGHWYHECQKVNSILVRKRGRLKELTEKQYLIRTDNMYKRTFKGFCLSLTLFEELDMPTTGPFFSVNRGVIAMASHSPITESALTELIDLWQKIFHRKEIYQAMARATIELTSLGVDLDLVNSQAFNWMLQLSLQNLLTKEPEEMPMEIPPELQEQMFRIFVNTKNVLIESLKEVEKEVNKVESKLRKKYQIDG